MNAPTLTKNTVKNSTHIIAHNATNGLKNNVGIRHVYFVQKGQRMLRRHMTPQQKIIQKFEERLGNDEFVTPHHLIEIGLFGSHTALSKVLQKGVITCLRVSRNRTLIPREEVLKFIHENIFCKQK